MFEPRLSIPARNDRRWININMTGWNKCIQGSPSYAPFSVLANCTGYAWGRALELLNLTTDYDKLKLSINQASVWYQQAEPYYARGQVPKLGAIACWGQTNGGSGHVAVVEAIKSNGDILCSNSAYNGTGGLGGTYPYFYMWTYTKASNFTNGFDSSYYFQGFIYLPIKYDEGKRRFPFVLYANKLRKGR